MFSALIYSDITQKENILHILSHFDKLSDRVRWLVWFDKLTNQSSHRERAVTVDKPLSNPENDYS